MKLNQLFSAFIMLLFFVNCSKENSFEHEISKEVKVTATFKCLTSDRNVSTRVIDNTWEKGDAIGLFMMNSGSVLDETVLANNIKYVSNGTDVFINPSENKVHYPFNKQKVDFIAYYPYLENLDDYKYLIDLPFDQKTFKNEFVYTNDLKGLDSENTNFPLKFDYKLVKVNVSIFDGVATEPLDLENNKSVKIQITNAFTKGFFLLNNNSLEIDKTTKKDISFKIEGNKAMAVLLPDDDLSDNSLLIKINGESFSLPLSDLTSPTSFELSSEYHYNYRLMGSELTGISATINDRDNIIIVDDIFLSPDPVDGDSGSSDVEEGSGGDESSDSGNEGGDSNNPNVPDPGDDLGMGTEGNPYTINQVIGLLESFDINDSKGTIYLDNVWIKGYIVGSFALNSFKSSETQAGGHSKYNVALSYLHEVKKDDKDLNMKLFPVCFGSKDNISNIIGIHNTENYNKNFGRNVLINGDLGNGDIGLNIKPAILNVKSAFFLDDIEKSVD